MHSCFYCKRLYKIKDTVISYRMSVRPSFFLYESALLRPVLQHHFTGVRTVLPTAGLDRVVLAYRKALHVQKLERYSNDGFIKIIKTFYKNNLEYNLAYVKESSDSKLELFSTIYDNFSMPCYLNMDCRPVGSNYRLGGGGGGVAHITHWGGHT